MKDYLDLVIFVNQNITCVLNDVSENYILDNVKTQHKHHKHDKLFRQILNNKEEVAKLINQELDPEEKVKAENLEKYETHYITNKFEERIADIVYKLKDKEVFFLIEHQTKVDENMPFRMADYSLSIMDSRKNSKDKKNKKLQPAIIPIVIYAGTSKWTAKKGLEESQEVFKHRKGSSSIIRYNLVDIRSVEEAIERRTAIARISVIDRLNSSEQLLNAVEKFSETLTSEKEREEFAREVGYIWEDRLEKDKLEKIKEIILKEKGGDEVMAHIHEVLRKEAEEMRKKAIEEGLQEGMQKGIQEGMQKGKREGRQESLIDVAKKMLMEKVDIDFITKITGLKKEQFVK